MSVTRAGPHDRPYLLQNDQLGMVSARSARSLREFRHFYACFGLRLDPVLAVMVSE